MRAFSQPLQIDRLGQVEQRCLALEPISLRAGDSGTSYDEGWLQTLIHQHPALLPVGDIEPGLAPIVPICMELPVPSGYIDNFMLTPDGGIVVVETKLWRNPEARREVVGQVLDYAKDLSSFTFEDLQHAVSKALKSKETKIFELVESATDGLDESKFIDSISRNLRLGRFLLIIAGDGIQEGAEQLAGFLQRHIGLHFTLSLVEMSLWRSPADDWILVQPRVLARTVQIERAVVRVDAGVALSPVHIEPVTAAASRPSNLSEAQFNEQLGADSPELPEKLRTFLSKVADLGVYPDVKRNLSLKWRGPDGQEYHLGSIAPNGRVGTDYCNWSTNAIGRLDLSHAYLTDLAQILPEGSIKQTAKQTGWRVVIKDSDPQLSQLLDRETEWSNAIAKFIDSISGAIQAQS